MKTITIDGVEYNLTPVTKTTYKLLRQTLEFEVFPDDLGKFTWEYAKEACATLGDGWRLPTREELHIIWLNKDNIGGFAADYYWSSSDSISYYAWGQDFSIGNQASYHKASANYVRAVRTIK